MRCAWLVLSLLWLSGCASTGAKFASENYILDLERQRYCIEGRADCRSLSLIQPSFREAWIANAFAMPKQYYSWTASELAALLLNPPDKDYQPKLLSAKQYRLPPTFATHMVWDVLALEYYTLYGDDNGIQAIQKHPPQARRFLIHQ
ncbi:hypothetical protein Q4488_08195 [Amphritea sp. 1_MG-2023]|uniref:hypothetical protein n=1 Tax=Amphritea sp. 1_MG-2023 TaxID=3062670 RepID=UPI0026E45EE5|nr:hypothetical protein [Amphritea sp. 1_MG-2023]MDO6563362.1 hypothetical protein [Amphritea sp. 1_MG-2023]